MAAESKPKAEAEKARQEILYNLQKEIYEKILDADQRTRAPRPRGLPGREGRGEGEGRERREGEPRREVDRERGEGERREPVRREGREPVRRDAREQRRPEGGADNEER